MGKTRFILAGRFFDGNGVAARKNIFIATKGGIISAIDSVSNLPDQNSEDIDDFSHCVILPALVDCSTSLMRSPSIDEKVRLSYEESGHLKKASLLEQNIRYCHTHGVLGVAESDETTELSGYYKENLGNVGIVDLRKSRHLIQNKYGYAARGLTEGSFLRICYSRNIEEEGDSFLKHNFHDLCEILQQSRGEKTVVVANGMQHVKEAIEAGCDAIEQGFAMGEDNLRRMAQKGILWIPSVLRAKNALDGSRSGGSVCCRFSLRYVAPGRSTPGAETFWRKKLTEQLAQLRLSRKLGVKTALGTGAGNTGILHGELMVEEMKLFIKAGYSLEETIQCASGNGANFFSMDQLGALEVGSKATFLITRGSVQQLPRKLSYLEGIYVNGSPSLRR